MGEVTSFLRWRKHLRGERWREMKMGTAHPVGLLHPHLALLVQRGDLGLLPGLRARPYLGDEEMEGGGGF